MKMDRAMSLLIIATLSVSHGNDTYIDEQYQFRLSTDGNFSRGNSRNLFIRHDKLRLYCQLYNTSPDPRRNDTDLLVVQYKQQGIAPVVFIFNQTWSLQFRYQHTEQKSTDPVAESNPETPYWEKDISRDMLTFGGSDSVAKEPWIITVTMDVDNSTYRTNFTLLDVTTEPFLRPKLSDRLLQESPTSSDVEEILVSQSLCHANVAVVTIKRPPASDIFIGLTAEGFASQSVQWFALLASSLCATDGHRCRSLKVLDIALTNYRVLLLTDHGLFYSAEVHRTIPGSVLGFHVLRKALSCDVIESGKITFAGICQSRHHDIFRDDVATVAYKCRNKATYGAFSRGNVESWEPVEQRDNRSISAVVHNYHTDTLNTLYAKQNGAAVLEVMQLKDEVTAHYAFPPFEFPAEAGITGLVIHPVSCLYYAYGKQLWISEDGGNWFDMMYPLISGTIYRIAIGLADGVIVAQTTNQPTELLYSKAGVTRVAVLSVPDLDNCTVYVDSFGDVYCLLTNKALSIKTLDIIPLIREYKARSDHALLLQMFSPSEITFYEFSPDPAARSFFYANNVGQQISRGSSGSAIIQRLSFAPDCGGYLACVRVKLVEPYNVEPPIRSPALNCHIEVTSSAGQDGVAGQAIIKLTAKDGGSCTEGEWRSSDVYKTIVIPGKGSYLILHVLSGSHVEATAAVRSRGVIKRDPHHWHIVDFGLDPVTKMSVWHLSESECHHTLQVDVGYRRRTQFELDVDDKINFTTSVSVKDGVIGQSETMMYATLSNPWLFHTQSHLYTSTLPIYSQNLSLSIRSIIRVRGITVMRVHLPMASLMCSQTVRLLTIIAGCPTLKRLVYRYPTYISEEELLHGNPLDEYNNPLLHSLRPNYRPPSDEGVNIPLTDNIYNADPAIPRSTNIVERSQQSGRYKLCAGKSSREECQCTDDMKVSAYVNHSDCRERVYKLHFPGKLRPELMLLQQGRLERKLGKNELISIIEVNARSSIIHCKASAMLDMMVKEGFAKKGTLHNPHMLAIEMQGTELYHFRAVVLEGCSFCKLQVEFMVYVHSAPLAYPLHFVVNFSVTLFVGTSLAASYTYYLYKTSGLRKFRRTTPAGKLPEKGRYPPWKMAQALATKEKQRTEVTDTD